MRSGIQDLFARAFPTSWTAATGSWLAKAAQGRGVGKEMRERSADDR